MKARALGLCLTAHLALGCSYDLDVLKGRGDASVDRAAPVDTAAVDRPGVDVLPDVTPDAMVTPDAGVRDASTGACTVSGVERVTPGPNGVTVIDGTTMGALANPLTLSCVTTLATNSTRIYRYEVEAGSRLVASTNTGRCNGHDTVLAAYFSCEGGGRPAGSAAASCNDDDMPTDLCAACPGAPGLALGCGTTFSTLELTNLVPHDVIYFAVANYGGAGGVPSGPFRLTIAENGLKPVPLPARADPLTGAPQCACPAAPPATPGTVINFPSMGDGGSLASGSRAVFAMRTLPFAQIRGVSARLSLSRFVVNNTGACAVPGDEPRAVLDLSLGTSLVASVALNASVARSGFVTIPYVATAPMALTSLMALLQYRVRPIAPMDPTCFSLDVDLSGPNTVTLYGSN